VGGFCGRGGGFAFCPLFGDEIRSQIKAKSIELKDRAEDLSAEAPKRPKN
jgi:hypothetical protein